MQAGEDAGAPLTRDARPARRAQGRVVAGAAQGVPSVLRTVDAINTYVERYYGDALALLTKGTPAPGLSLEKACDLVYTFVLSGQEHRVTVEGAQAFWDHANKWSLAGGINRAPPGAPKANVHLTAYALGTLRLLIDAGLCIPAPLFTARVWNIDELVDDQNVPRWPKKFSHHSWRVSHWVGGATSIIYNLWHLAPAQCQALKVPHIADVLAAADALVNPRNGLLKCYRSELAQRVFKTLYRIRHDPEAGEVGGIVHLHWVNYATGRLPFKASGLLFERAKKLYWKAPFLEKSPYCLDFDIVQILRTSAPQVLNDEQVLDRAKRFIDDIDLFLSTELNEEYALHKLPGALATQHEAALILGLTEFGTSALRPVDIIRKAGWI